MSSLRQINLKGFDYGNKLLHRYSRQSCPERNCSRKRVVEVARIFLEAVKRRKRVVEKIV